MYLPAHFEEKRPELLHGLISTHPLGLLVTQDPAGEMVANTIPFLLEADPEGGPGILRAHVARSNPLWRESRTDVDSLVVFQGPQTYISPSMYPSKAATGKVVPTWNYIMAQGRVNEIFRRIAHRPRYRARSLMALAQTGDECA